MSGFFDALDVGASALSAERMNVVSSNLANAQTTRTPEGGPYRRKDPIFASEPKRDFASVLSDHSENPVHPVKVIDVVSDPNPPRMVYSPDHPDANPEGYVAYPNINPVEEMVDMITASRAYEAGVTALSTAVSMAERALGIGR